MNKEKNFFQVRKKTLHIDNRAIFNMSESRLKPVKDMTEAELEEHKRKVAETREYRKKLFDDAKDKADKLSKQIKELVKNQKKVSEKKAAGDKVTDDQKRINSLTTEIAKKVKRIPTEVRHIRRAKPGGVKNARKVTSSSFTNPVYIDDDLVEFFNDVNLGNTFSVEYDTTGAGKKKVAKDNEGEPEVEDTGESLNEELKLLSAKDDPAVIPDEALRRAGLKRVPGAIFMRTALPSLLTLYAYQNGLVYEKTEKDKNDKEKVVKYVKADKRLSDLFKDDWTKNIIKEKFKIRDFNSLLKNHTRKAPAKEDEAARDEYDRDRKLLQDRDVEELAKDQARLVSAALDARNAIEARRLQLERAERAKKRAKKSPKKSSKSSKSSKSKSSKSSKSSGKSKGSKSSK